MFSLGLQNFSRKAPMVISQNLVLSIFKRTKMDFKGKHVIMTGASTGIGWEVAKMLAEKQVCGLAILDRKMESEELNKLADCYPDTDIIFCQTDVSDYCQVEKNICSMSDKFNNCLDVTINCAAVLEDRDPELTIKVNLLGVIYSTLVSLRLMDKSNAGNGGQITNIASVLGLEPFGALAAYSASKHGIYGWTRSMADTIIFERTCVKHIVICPGVTETPLIADMKGKATFDYADEIAEKFLSKKQKASDCAKNMIKAMETDKNGSIWICDEGKLEEVKPTKYWTQKN